MNEKPERKRGQRAFTLVEILTVVSIISIMLGLLVNAEIGLHPGGGRQGAISQVMGVLDEGRMRAIESGTTVYVGFADENMPNPGQQLCSYIMFRGCTPEEIANSPQPPPADCYVPVSGWQSLPQGYYIDPQAQGSLLADATAKMTVTGLPEQPPDVYVVAFGSLGQVLSPLDATPCITVTEAKHSISGAPLIKIPSSNSSRFYIQVNRLTGRVQYEDGAVN